MRGSPLGRFAVGLLVWCVASAAVLSQFGRVTLGLLYTTLYVGFLLVAEFAAPAEDPPRWFARLRWVTVLGFVGFTVVVYGWMRRVLPPGTLPL